MTMYLPNDVVRPTGYEAGEFIEPADIPVPPPSLPRREIDEDEDRATSVR